MFVERYFTVPRPVEAVFDYLSDFTNTTEWDPGTLETTRTSGDGAVGTTYHNRSKFLGKLVELDYETVEHERPEKLVFRGHDEAVTTWTTDTMTFYASEDGAGTDIHYRADFVFTLWKNLIANFVIKPRVERVAKKTVAQLTEALLKLPETSA
jgi:carbon monoxide dehydrogenase subunit G